jgi:hypothetical protein
MKENELYTENNLGNTKPREKKFLSEREVTYLYRMKKNIFSKEIFSSLEKNIYEV